MILPSRYSIRLKDFDYSSNGAYFVTICTQGRQEIFGFVGVNPCVDPLDPHVDPNQYMQLNDIGDMVNDWWLKIPDKFPNIDLENFK